MKYKVVRFGAAAGSCPYYVINVTLVEARFVSRELLENLFFNMTSEQTSVVWSKPTTNSNTTNLQIDQFHC